MKSTKTRITNLKSKVNEQLPDGDDIFNFPGISKALIIDVLNDCYNIVVALDEYEKSFEAILLERSSSQYFDKASKLLKEDFSIKKDDFNQFLDCVAKFHFRIKETYITLAKEPIKTDVEIQKAKVELIELRSLVEEQKEFNKSITEIHTNSLHIYNDLNEKYENAEAREKAILEDLDVIDKQKSGAELAAQKIPTWEENIKAIKEDISEKSVEYKELAKKIELLQQSNKALSEKSEKAFDDLNVQLDKNYKFQEEIQKTIEDANRHGMAGSFKKRKDELKFSLIMWGIATIVSIVLLIFISYHVLLEIKKEDLELTRVIVRLPIFASCVWLGWFCAKQYGFTSRIMEDYSYKYAVSMAFEGYRKATKEIDTDLQLKLLEMTILNISNSPLNIYETSNNHGTPIHEIFKDLPKKIRAKQKVASSEFETEIEK